ncbi:MAG TPA: phosphatidylinositol-specific phospholipase C/glycerophosphodiester phosphodiesterase family protein [Verrucomicrobiales bacterium]|nr:phosphatidylinositol-specific phospholipase C/glycerophosphodiester phosphodiesterase family protein [Verrucomicrobiales bacterium]
MISKPGCRYTVNMRLTFLLAGIGGTVLAVLPTVAAGPPSHESASSHPTPLPGAHAHNDYRHPRPLLDALELGFTSVEADVFFVDESLLVGHDRGELSPDRTLESLYLRPLQARVDAFAGRIYPESTFPFFLLIDLKSEAVATYQAVHTALEAYAPMLTRFDKEAVHPGAVTVIISGNRPREVMQDQERRLAGFDGRCADLGAAISAAFMPWISDDWTSHFRWNGEGAFPEDERRKLEDLVRKTHAEKKLLRLWAAPDRPEAWSVLRDADVDLINTDRLSGLARFLRDPSS